MRCLEAERGSELWAFETRGGIDSSPVVVGERVFFGSNDGNVYAVGLGDGGEKWKFEAGSQVSASPAVGQGRLVIGTEDGQIYCFGRKEGAKR